MIKPSIGRVVWFTPWVEDPELRSDQKLAAMITYVWSDNMVNLVVFGPNGTVHDRTSTPLIQDGALKSPTGSYAEWMPYQMGQAAKTEQAKKKLADATEKPAPEPEPETEQKTE